MQFQHSKFGNTESANKGLH